MTRSVLCIARASTPRTIIELVELWHRRRSCASSAKQNHCPTPLKCANNVLELITFPIVRRGAPPNCCKRLTKRRLFARGPSGPLEQSTLGGRRGSRTAHLQTARAPG